MKKILCTLLILLGWQHQAQSPILTVPPYYRDVLNYATIPLPTPAVADTSLYNSFIDIGYLEDSLGATVFGYDARPAKACHNTIYGVNGELQAFIIDEYVFDRNGYLLDVFDDNLYRAGLQENEISVIPDPNNCNKYFIIGVKYEERDYDLSSLGYFTGELYYSVLDLSLDRSSCLYNETLVGGLVPDAYGNKARRLHPIEVDPGYPDYPYFENSAARSGAYSFAVSPLNSSGERFLFIAQAGFVQRFVIDNAGITWDQSASDYFVALAGSSPFGDGLAMLDLRSFFPIPANVTINNIDRLQRQELEVIKLSNGNYRLARCFTASFTGGNSDTYMATFDMDSNGEFISGSEQIFSIKNSTTGSTYSSTEDLYMTGLEFSPDGNILYATATYSSSHNTEPIIRYVDFSDTAAGVQHLNPSNEEDFASGFIELGANGVLYFAGDEKLGSLSSPNSANPSYFNSSAVSLTGYVYANAYEPNSTSSFKFAYVLPDQIDSEGWEGRFENDSICCLPATGGVSGGYTVSGTQTWTSGSNPFNNAIGDVYVTGDINVEAGANLTITGMIFHFAETSRVNIKKTGKLTINGTTLTSRSCEGLMWQGVRVWGDPTAGPATTYQGSFTMTDNSEISNAYLGVCNYNAGYNTADTSQQTYLGDEGGRITATNSFFLNNIRDVVIAAYNSKGGNYNFTNTVFETSAPILNGDNPGAHVTLDDVDNINFKGCDFQNTTNGVYDYSDLGKGIIAYDAKFTVNYRCTSTGLGCPIANRDSCKFNNLYKGVHASNTINRVVNILNAQFNDVIYGVLFEEVDNSSCTNNSFTNIGLSDSLGGYGIDLYQCTGYTIENNKLYGVPNTYFFTSGIIVVNSNNGGVNADVNEIYNNKFYDVKNGVMGVGQNVQLSGVNPVTNTGLQIWCNEFEDSQQHDITWFWGGISPFQGDGSEPSNNRFSTTIPSAGDYWNYNLDTNAYGNYIYRVDYSFSQTKNGYNISPQNFNDPNTDTVPQTGSFSPGTSCPISGGRLGLKSTIVSLYDNYQQDLISSNLMRSELENIDLQAKNSINSFKLGNASYVHLESELIIHNGSLNDEVLIDILIHADQIPHQTVKNILLSNAPFSKVVLDAVHYSTLSDKVKSQIIVFSNEHPNQNNRLAKERQIALLEIKARRNIDQDIAYILSDTSFNENDQFKTVAEFYAKSNSISDKLKLIDLALAYRHWDVVNDEIDYLTTFGDSDLSEYCDFYRLYMQAEETKNCLHDCDDSVLLAKLTDYYFNSINDEISIKASAMLRSYFDKHYEFEFTDIELVKSKTIKNNLPIANDDEKDILIYPNPSTGIVNILINLQTIESGNVTVFDQLGKQILKTNLSNSLGYVDLSNYPKGLYLIVVTTESGQNYTERIVIK